MDNKRIFIIVVCSFIGMVLVSCESGVSTSADDSGLFPAGAIERTMSPDRLEKAPSQIFDELSDLISTVENMSLNELNSLSQEAMGVLSTPLTDILLNTVRFPDEAVNELNNPMQRIGELISSEAFNEEPHKKLSEEISQISEKFSPFAELRDALSSDQIEQLFKEWNRGDGFDETCNTLFNVNHSGVFLLPGDNLAAAHTFCENSDLFYLSEGVYYRQFVEDVRNNVSWIGSGKTLLDGMESTEIAFQNKMRGALFGWFEIKNYTHFGIRAIQRTGTADISVKHMVFRNIGKEVDGQKHGAVKIEWARNVEIKDSYFENVTSAIRLLNSEGPISVLENRALNPGRNFMQCDKCKGAEIRIESNIMEHTQQYGTNKLEDFINIYESSGTEDNYILVRQNRARTNGTGEGVSPTGSFIILGDHGGDYQIAEENIGVNPGNVGIGAAGGNHIHIRNNKMYSDPIEGISNVAYYSFLTPPDSQVSCSNHISSGNRAYWYCFSDACDAGENAILNKAYSPEINTMIDYCGLVNFEINAEESVLEDSSLTPDIWGQF